MEEIWKDVIGYEGLYQVSSLGRVKKLPEPKRKDKKGRIWGRDGRMLSPGRNSKGYYSITLTKNKMPQSIKLHRLVLTHFKPNPSELPEINHIDGNKLNNNIDNLEWCTRQQNIDHAVQNKLMYTRRGAECSKKLTEEDAKFIITNKGRNNAVELMARFNIKRATVYNIQYGLSWRHLHKAH